tara:strand:+ start:659 stop:1357 length:699 start_codon:yes stop_codon:yes gene_type:complete
MAITRINVGTLANDGTGDDLRQAFVKVNNNFDDLDARTEGQATADNLGSGTGIFYSKEAGVIGLKSLVSGTNIEITNDADTVTISNNGTIILQGSTGTGSIAGASRTLLINGGDNITTNASSNSITVNIDPTGLVLSDTTPQLGGPLNADNNNIVDVGVLTANTITGALTGTVDGINITSLYNSLGNVLGFDYGTVVVNVTNALDFFVSQQSIDYGTIVSPGSIGSDFGAIV